LDTKTGAFRVLQQKDLPGIQHKEPYCRNSN
jgi:hypothetical protein